MFNGYTWQTRILEVRPDRLPPEYEPQPYVPPSSGVRHAQGGESQLQLHPSPPTMEPPAAQPTMEGYQPGSMPTGMQVPYPPSHLGTQLPTPDSIPSGAWPGGQYLTSPLSNNAIPSQSATDSSSIGVPSPAPTHRDIHHPPPDRRMAGSPFGAGALGLAESNTRPSSSSYGMSPTPPPGSSEYLSGIVRSGSPASIMSGGMGLGERESRRSSMALSGGGQGQGQGQGAGGGGSGDIANRMLHVSNVSGWRWIGSL